MSASPAIQCAADRFVASAASRSPATAANYRHAVDLFLTASQGACDSVGATRFLQALSTQTLANSSRATYISAARSFLKFLADEELIPRSPLNVLRRPRITRARVNYLQQPDAEALIPCARSRPQAHAAVILLLGLGLRVSEAVQAQWRHLYEESGTHALLIPCAKGGQSRIAIVPQKLFHQLQAVRRAQGLPDGLDSVDKRFILGRRYSRQRLYQIVRSLGAQAGLKNRCGPHTLRHSFATLAARAGAQPYDLQESLGHQKLETTMFYVHLVRGLKNPVSAIVSDKLFK